MTDFYTRASIYVRVMATVVYMYVFLRQLRGSWSRNNALVWLKTLLVVTTVTAVLSNGLSIATNFYRESSGGTYDYLRKVTMIANASFVAVNAFSWGVIYLPSNNQYKEDQ